MTAKQIKSIVTFYYNWNKKLDCNYYTAIRLRNDYLYSVGSVYGIVLQTGNRKITRSNAKIIEIRNIKLNQINEFIARINYGQPVDQAKHTIINMHSRHQPPIDWQTQELSFILFEKQKKQ